MIHSTQDTSLTPPDPPDRLPRLGLAPAGLELAARAGDSPFLIGGDRVTVTGPQRMPVGAVRIDGRLVATDVSASMGRPANLGLSPGRLRREWVGGSGSSLETVVASPTLPLVAIQWASNARPPLIVSLTLLPDAGPLRYWAEGGSIVATPNSAADQRSVITLYPPEGDWSVEAAHGGGLRVTTRTAESGLVTLLVTSGSQAEVAAAQKAAEHLDAHERLSADFRPDGGLTLSSGVSEIDDGVVWARARLAVGLTGSPSSYSHRSDPSSVLWSGLGALAAGDSRSARKAITAMGELATWPYGALLAGRLALLTGDPGPARQVAEFISDRGAPSDDLTPEDRSFGRVALGAVADGLRHSAADQLIAEVRRAEKGLTTDRRGRQLPMIDASAMQPDVGTWLEGALAGGAQTRVPSVSGLAPVISAWGQSGSDPDAAWVAWRSELSRGLREGAAGPGTWDRWDPRSLGTPIAGAILATLVHGFLGVAPDAPVGRIRIGPRFPRHLTALRALGLAVGDAEIELSYERVSSRHVFTLLPQKGRVPPVVVFEPEVHGRITKVLVDGLAADLETSPVEGGRTKVSAQIPVDSRRTVEVETE